MTRKSQWIGLVLTLLLGPLGVFYANTAAALILIGISVILLSVVALFEAAALLVAGLLAVLASLAATVVVSLFVWLLSVPISALCIRAHNQAVREYDRRHHELVAAARAKPAPTWLPLDAPTERQIREQLQDASYDHLLKQIQALSIDCRPYPSKPEAVEALMGHYRAQRDKKEGGG